MVQVQITPVPTPRSSPIPSPAPTEQDERSNPREEPTLEVEEHKIIFTNKHKPTNVEHVQSNSPPSVGVFDKGSTILNGFVGQTKEEKGNHSVKETIALNETSRQPINR